jgi:tRNA-modifying protein YgfZ
MPRYERSPPFTEGWGPGSESGLRFTPDRPHNMGPMADASPVDGARRLAESAGVRRLDDEVCRVSGEDARSWLNGQITNDVAVPCPGKAVHALIVSLKGRIITDLFVLDAGGDTLDLLLPAGRGDAVAEYLDRFIIMEDVELSPVADAVVLSVQGPSAAQVTADGPGWPCARLGTDGREWVVSAGEADQKLAALCRAAEGVGGGAVSRDAWELARLRAGVPTLGVDFGEDTYPQEAGLKERSVSFGKGCYQGQEAVVMLEHRGKPPKKLVQLRVEATKAPTPGSTLTNAEGKNVGYLTSSALDPEAGLCLALGYLKRDHAVGEARFEVQGAPATVATVLGG